MKIIHKVATRQAHSTGQVAFANFIKTDGISASVLLSKPKSEKEVDLIRRKRARNAQHASRPRPGYFPGALA